ncbi:hypothetical protein HORIV_17010 [Vreelandella olivaria]|uniref:Uncharacterized protein n=1 Tax=Vreelandella olivaria TaxID=390919 RepID=A0ABN5WWB3_9GAMM|nr:hypothetical protein HORIV_17010 [Halomonas olivaria]
MRPECCGYRLTGYHCLKRGRTEANLRCKQHAQPHNERDSSPLCAMLTTKTNHEGKGSDASPKAWEVP